MIGTWPSIDHGLLSPSGRTSKRARKAAMEREQERLWPDDARKEAAATSCCGAAVAILCHRKTRRGAGR